MNGKQLKNSILQWAIQGKLVPQDPNDEPASVLLERIRKEKARLVKEKKIKKDKNESIIYRGEDNSYYEKVLATGEVKCIDAEIPFEIPDSWRWARIESLAKTNDTASFSDGPFGSNLKREHQTERKEVRIIQLSNIGELGWNDSNEKYTSYKHLETIARCEVYPGDFVIAKMMPAGRTIMAPSLKTKMVLGSDAMRFVPSDALNKEYLLVAMHSQGFLQQVYNEAHGITRIRTSLTKLKSYFLPIPPLFEQKRIVDFLDNILPLVETYSKYQDEKDSLNTSVKGKLQKSILQEAIQGRLVPQIAEEGTAQELLEQIRAEKKRLVKEGKLKKSALSDCVIYKGDDNKYYEKSGKEVVCIDDQIPFEIPTSWVWCRLKQISDIARGGSPRPIKDFLTSSHEGVNWIKIGDTDKGGKYIFSTNEKIKASGVSKSRMVHKGDFLLTNSMSFGRPYITMIDGCIHDGWLVISPIAKSYDQDFLYYLLSSSFAYRQFLGKVSGAVVKNLNSDKVSEALFPLPPLAEQQRIVEKIEMTLSKL